MADDDITALSHEEAMLKVLWEDILKRLHPGNKTDLAYIWTKEVQEEFRQAIAIIEKIKLLFRILYQRGKISVQELERLENDAATLDKYLKKVKSQEKWLESVREDLQKIISDIEKEKKILSRRQFVKRGMQAAAFTGAALAGITGAIKLSEQRKENQINERLDSIAKEISKHTGMDYELVKKSLQYIGRRPDAPVTINGASMGIISDYGENAIGQALKSSVICLPDSKFMDFVYNQIGEGYLKFIKDNVSYIVFHKELFHDLGFMKEKVSGLSLNNGVILIETGDSSFPRELEFYPSVIAHESRHQEYRKRLNILLAIPDLNNEYEAMLTELRALRSQESIFLDSNEENKRGYAMYTLPDRIRGVQARIDTANFLKGFGNTFLEVYPENVILSKDLIAVRQSLDINVLNRIFLQLKNSEIEIELKNAIWATLIVMTMKRQDAISELYKHASNWEADPYKIMNAFYALAYLAPNAVIIKEHSSNALRGKSIDINETKTGKYLIRDREFEMARDNFSNRMKQLDDENKRRASAGFDSIASMVVLPQSSAKFQAIGTLPTLAQLFSNSR